MLWYLAAATNGGSGSDGGGGSFMPTLLLIGLLGAVFYFLIILPNQRKQRQHSEMVSKLKKGEHVVTTGGLHGIVVGTKEKVVVIRIDDKTKVEVERSAITSVRTTENG